MIDCKMRLLLKRNRSDQEELAYYAIACHLDNLSSRKPVAKIWPILAEIFFQPLRPPSPVRNHACLSSYAKLAKTNDAISRKWTKTSFWAKF